MPRPSFAALLAVVLLGASLAAAAEPPSTPPYQQRSASRDGIGKFYEGREIAQVMGFDGAPWLERPDREREERPDLLLADLGLRAGMMVADIGAGSGYLTQRLAPRVAPGTVFAVDLQPGMIDLLRKLAAAPGFANIQPVESAADDVRLAAESLDLALMVDVYHELEYPREVLQSVVRALKHGGRMVFVEYRGEDPAVPIKALHKMSVAQLRREMRATALVWERTSEILPVQHIVVFRKP